MLTRASPGVYIIDHRRVEDKHGIVLGTRAAVAIDAGNYPDDGQAMADLIRAQGQRADLLLSRTGTSMTYWAVPPSEGGRHSGKPIHLEERSRQL